MITHMLSKFKMKPEDAFSSNSQSQPTKPQPSSKQQQKSFLDTFNPRTAPPQENKTNSTKRRSRSRSRSRSEELRPTSITREKKSRRTIEPANNDLKPSYLNDKDNRHQKSVQNPKKGSQISHAHISQSQVRSIHQEPQIQNSSKIAPEEIELDDFKILKKNSVIQHSSTIEKNNNTSSSYSSSSSSYQSSLSSLNSNSQQQQEMPSSISNNDNNNNNQKQDSSTLKSDSIMLQKKKRAPQQILENQTNYSKLSSLIDIYEGDIGKPTSDLTCKDNFCQPLTKIQCESEESKNKVLTNEEDINNPRNEDLPASPEENLNSKLPKYLFLQKPNFNHRDPRRFKFVDENKKLNLVLDLDETLISAKYIDLTQNAQNVEIYNQIKKLYGSHLNEFNYRNFRGLFIMRPYLHEFLLRVKQYYNINVYSHSRIECVREILDKIDPTKSLIDRTRMFGNMGQVQQNSKKLLVNLGYSEEEIKKTIIIDDQLAIWDKEFSRVIPSKKYLPMTKYSKGERVKQSVLFINEDDHQFDSKGALKQSNGEQEYFVEDDLEITELSQLQLLSQALIKIAKDYFLSFRNREEKQSYSEEQDLSPKIEKLYSKVLEGVKAKIITENKERKKLFEDILDRLGGHSVKHDHKAHMLFIDESNLQANYKQKIRSILYKNPTMEVLSIYWLSECFYSISVVDKELFMIEEIY